MSQEKENKTINRRLFLKGGAAAGALAAGAAAAPAVLAGGHSKAVTIKNAIFMASI